jgi:ribose 5-phosphate isomerase B
MTVFLGADHGGFALKEALKALLKSQGYELIDQGNTVLDPADDFPIFAAKVGREVSLHPDTSRGILICRSGAGVDIVANKFPGVRSVLSLTPDQVFQSRNDDDVNVIAIASDYIDEETAKKMVSVFLETPYDAAERRVRRLQQISDIENKVRGENY